MNEIKPVAWRRFSKVAQYWLLTDDMPHEVNSYEALYPAAALEALQAENAAQAKRIAELEKHLFEVVNDCIMLDSECSKFESVIKANEYLSAQKGTE